MKTTLTQAISDMLPTRINDKDIMLYVCMRLCNSKLTFEDISAFNAGQPININTVDARRIFVFKHTIDEHIYGYSGYNTCLELLHAMVLGSHGSMGVPRHKLNETAESIQRIYVATHDPNTFGKAARFFTTIVQYNMVLEYSAAFGYLMLNHALVREGYDKFVSLDEEFINKLLYNDNKEYTVRVNEILNILSEYYTAIK